MGQGTRPFMCAHARFSFFLFTSRLVCVIRFSVSKRIAFFKPIFVDFISEFAFNLAFVENNRLIR